MGWNNVDSLQTFLNKITYNHVYNFPPHSTLCFTHTPTFISSATKLTADNVKGISLAEKGSEPQPESRILHRNCSTFPSTNPFRERHSSSTAALQRHEDTGNVYKSVHLRLNSLRRTRGLHGRCRIQLSRRGSSMIPSWACALRPLTRQKAAPGCSCPSPGQTLHSPEHQRCRGPPRQSGPSVCTLSPTHREGEVTVAAEVPG